MKFGISAIIIVQNIDTCKNTHPSKAEDLATKHIHDFVNMAT